MLVIALSFIYIMSLAYIYGNTVSVIVNKTTAYKIKYFTSFIWAGVLIFSVYAQVFSLFAGVGLTAFLILTITGSVLAFVCRKELIKNLKTQLNVKQLVAYSILLILFSYGTSRGYSHYDTGLYHAQAIRWVEEYGVVKGLALLHCRFGYNSAAFPLSALFSFRFFGMFESMHEMAGFFTFVLSLELVDFGHIIRDKKIKLSDIIRTGIFYYLTLVFNEIVSPASDYFVMSLIFYIILIWVKLIEEDEQLSTPYSLVCVLSVFACSIKFSACFIILLTIYPVILMIKEKKAIRIPVYLGLGFITILPFFIRNVIISGRLLYPSTMLDFFNVDWKISAEMANYDRMGITAWARGVYSTSGYYMSLKEWFPAYFASQSAMTKLMFMTNVLAFIIFIIALIIILCKKNKKHYPWILTVIVIYINFLVWFVTAPMVRYGYVYLICPSLLVIGYLLVDKKWGRVVLIAVCSLFILWKGTALVKYVYEVRNYPYYITQQPYEKFEVTPYQMENEIVYLPVNDDRTGYEYFPSVPSAGCKLRGESFKDGFTY